MGNQPPKKPPARNGRGKNRKIINNAKNSIEQKNIEKTVKIVTGGGLNAGGKNILSISLLAACIAHSKYKNDPKSDLSKISHRSVSSVIRRTKSEIPSESRIVLRTSISTALNSLMEYES